MDLGCPGLSGETPTTYNWVAGNEGMEKHMKTTIIMGCMLGLGFRA